jgi:beta-glucosidase
MEGGLAISDLLCGDAVPSGKLVDTFAKRLEDYPSSYNFHESERYVEYTEDIYVGYRYFETIPGAAQKVNYPFGYGLSYTEFRVEPKEVLLTGDTVEVYAAVINTGAFPGKEVVQLYVSAPQGKLGKPKRELKAFGKTRLLAQGETQTVKLTVPVASLASYDDLGKVCPSAYVLEQGDYHFYLGTDVRSAKELESFVYHVEKDTVTIQLSQKCAPNLLKERMTADGLMEALPTDEKAVRISDWISEGRGARFPDVKGRPGAVLPDTPKGYQLEDVAEGRCSLDTFMDQLSIDELIGLLCGQPNTGVANTFGFGNLPEYGVPNAMTADGPAGLRIAPECGVETTAFPCATLLACTWNEPLVERIGAAGGLEVRENHIGTWLTPAMNIHRSPLCGRNFEYYSEDPLIAGKTGAAMVRGIQSQKVAASVKHFACNNKETCRFESDSRVSERALREIYLKGFEIVVKEADPWTIMTSYNIINGERASEKTELLTGILREEWGFGGMVTTDWWNHGEQYLEIKAGNDVKMGCGYPKSVKEAYEEGKVTQEEIRSCARRVLELILKLG